MPCWLQVIVALQAVNFATAAANTARETEQATVRQAQHGYSRIGQHTTRSDRIPHRFSVRRKRQRWRPSAAPPARCQSVAAPQCRARRRREDQSSAARLEGAMGPTEAVRKDWPLLAPLLWHSRQRHSRTSPFPLLVGRCGRRRGGRPACEQLGPLHSLASAAFTGVRGGLFWLAGTRVVTRLRLALFGAMLKQILPSWTPRAGELASRLSATRPR